MSSIYDDGLERRDANYAPLTPTDFLVRASTVYGDRTAIVYGEARQTWRETFARCRRLASALKRVGVERGDTVAVLLPNIPAMIEAHFGIPMRGAVLNTLNTRLDASSILHLLRHGEAKTLIIDAEYACTLQRVRAELPKLNIVVVYDDAVNPRPSSTQSIGYEEFLSEGDPEYVIDLPKDEWDAIALNYTSGTTGQPKGVVYHHRGAYLNALSNILEWDMPKHPVYLWTLPLFHCNGWCFAWTIAARAGVNVCLRRFDAKTVLDLIRAEKVTHYCGAPIVQAALVNAPVDWRNGIDHEVKTMVAGAAPSLSVISGLQEIGFELTHVYGLTEVYGPAAVCAVQDGWSRLDLDERTVMMGRQGVRYHLQSAVTVINPDTLQEVPRDGATVGEVVFKGNICMKGYLKDRQATTDAFEGGWFRSGDLGVLMEDGYLRLKDRSKDLIISGGENISSIEVEEIISTHRAVALAAVVAMPDKKWGEVPCAFIELKPGKYCTEEEIIQHCRSLLAGFKVPKAVFFGELPKTATGKIQKFTLRELVGSATAINTSGS